LTLDTLGRASRTTLPRTRIALRFRVEGHIPVEVTGMTLSNVRDSLHVPILAVSYGADLEHLEYVPLMGCAIA
jgi:hypothetical protein